MLLGFGYLYKFVMLYFFSFQKAENSRLQKSWPKCFNIFLFLLKIWSVGSVDQQINLVPPQVNVLICKGLLVETLK